MRFDFAISTLKEHIDLHVGCLQGKAEGPILKGGKSAETQHIRQHLKDCFQLREWRRDSKIIHLVQPHTENSRPCNQGRFKGTVVGIVSSQARCFRGSEARRVTSQLLSVLARRRTKELDRRL